MEGLVDCHCHAGWQRQGLFTDVVVSNLKSESLGVRSEAETFKFSWFDDGQRGKKWCDSIHAAFVMGMAWMSRSRSYRIAAQ